MAPPPPPPILQTVVENLYPLPESPVVTDWAWALEEAAKSGDLEVKLAKWKKRRTKREESRAAWDLIKARFMASRQTVLYKLKPSDVTDVIAKTVHALGTMSHEDSRDPKHDDVFNATQLYPVILLLHDLLENLGRVPTWTEFEEFLLTNPDLCLQSFLKAVRLDPETNVVGWRSEKLAAIRYRLGNFYYSFLREVHLIVVLRRVYGLDVRYHPLLDAEWKIDAVCGEALVELFIRSAKLKGEVEQRKETCAEHNPDRPVLRLCMEKKRYGGKCWRFSNEEIEKAAAKLHAITAS